MKKMMALAALAGLSANLYAGIYRHDVAAEAYKKLAAEKQFDCVGVVFNSKGAKGSCVLIGDRYVLSAAHCFIESETVKDTMRVDGNLWTIYRNINEHVADITEYTFRFNRKRYPGKKATIYPAYTDSAIKGKCDLVLIELAEPVKDVAPAKLNTYFDELGSVTTGVGYGASGAADKPEEVDLYMEKIAGNNIIDTLDGYKLGEQYTVLTCDFDHPTNTKLNQTGKAKALPLEYTCAGGDSGGGLFRQKNGTYELIGICAGATTNMQTIVKDGYYGGLMHWTRIAVFADWIKATIKQTDDARKR